MGTQIPVGLWAGEPGCTFYSEVYRWRVLSARLLCNAARIRIRRQSKPVLFVVFKPPEQYLSLSLLFRQ